MPSLYLLLGILILLLISLFCLTAIKIAFRRLSRKETKKELDLVGKPFFYRSIASFFFPEHEHEDLYFSCLFTQNVLRFFYVILSLWIVGLLGVTESSPSPIIESFIAHWPSHLAFLFFLFFFLFFIGDYLGRIIGNRYPNKSIALCGPIASVPLTLVFPATFLLLKLFRRFPTIYVDPTHEPLEDAKQELMEIIEGYTFHTQLDVHDKKLIHSVMEFKDRIAREVMVPRVAIFSLSDDTTIEEAAKLLSQEGYSRTPVYNETLDNIVGVLMYKDILQKYMEYAEKGDRSILEHPISTILKNILYTPETKKIAQLLQEFRKEQVHLAIIVDEYGGTEGIVTIEDILEEIVGDIADEYDETEALFLSLPEGGWLIDGRMSIFDIEEQLGIEILQEGDFDTIGGYIFHETGTIPPKGFIIKKDHFELEVIRSNNRRVEKVRIQAISPFVEEEKLNE